MEFDKAITLTGYGKFHYETVAVCAISILSVGFQNGVSPYIFPAVQCELDLNSFQLGLLNVSFLIGGTISSFIWGILADFKGRKKILSYAHLLNAFITILLSISPFVLSLIICRFLNGFLIGAPGSIIFSYLSEFQPPRYRSSIVCYSGLFFTSSWLLLPLLAWFILPFDVVYKIGSLVTVTSWRVLLIILVIPEIICGLCFLLRLPESPKFFMAKSDTRKTLIVLRRMFAINTGKHPNEFPVKTILCDQIKIQTKPNLQCRGNTTKVVQEMFQQFKSLFQPPLISITSLICVIMFTNMFGVFGLGLWLPELFVRFEKFQNLHPNETVTLQQLALLNEIKNSSSCQPSFDTPVIQSTVTMGVTSLLANAVSGWLVERVPLKTIPFVTMLIGGFSAMSIYWLRSPIQNLIVASLFQASMVTANMAIGSVAVELFPTSVVAMAFCLIMFAGRIGAMASNLIFGLLMDRQCEIPIFVVAISVLIGAVLCYIIPKKRRKQQDVGVLRNNAEISIVTNESKL